MTPRPAVEAFSSSGSLRLRFYVRRTEVIARPDTERPLLLWLGESGPGSSGRSVAIWLEHSAAHVLLKHLAEALGASQAGQHASFVAEAPDGAS